MNKALQQPPHGWGRGSGGSALLCIQKTRRSIYAERGNDRVLTYSLIKSEVEEGRAGVERVPAACLSVFLETDSEREFCGCFQEQYLEGEQYRKRGRH